VRLLLHFDHFTVGAVASVFECGLIDVLRQKLHGSIGKRKIRGQALGWLGRSPIEVLFPCEVSLRSSLVH
jgi:hypothetical protein